MNADGVWNLFNFNAWLLIRDLFIFSDRIKFSKSSRHPQPSEEFGLWQESIVQTLSAEPQLLTAFLLVKPDAVSRHAGSLLKHIYQENFTVVAMRFELLNLEMVQAVLRDFSKQVDWLCIMSSHIMDYQFILTSNDNYDHRWLYLLIHAFKISNSTTSFCIPKMYIASPNWYEMVYLHRLIHTGSQSSDKLDKLVDFPIFTHILNTIFLYVKKVS